MSTPLFDLPPRKLVPIEQSTAGFPINRIFCIGRNYLAHAAEMGFSVDKSSETPFYFCKDASAYVPTGSTVPYALMTNNLHYEVELAVAIGAKGLHVSVEEADSLIYGYMVALDMTRRDLQAASRDKGLPWDFSKNFEDSCILSSITPKDLVPDPNNLAIELQLNGVTRQSSTTASLIWNVQEIIADISRYYELVPGDIILTGTPDGVGPVQPGDKVTGSVSSVGELELTIGEPKTAAL